MARLSREKIIEIVEEDTEADGMLLHFMSFGYKYGIPAEADLVFDVRCLPNPFYMEELRILTGLDAPVREYVFSSEEAGADVELHPVHSIALINNVMVRMFFFMVFRFCCKNRK